MPNENPRLERLFEQAKQDLWNESTVIDWSLDFVVPQAKRLRLSLNLGFHEIDDPKCLCVDVSNLGRWGNGDVEVGLSSAEQLPYVMGLIRQAFDHQMGSQADN